MIFVLSVSRVKILIFGHFVLERSLPQEVPTARAGSLRNVTLYTQKGGREGQMHACAALGVQIFERTGVLWLREKFFGQTRALESANST